MSSISGLVLGSQSDHFLCQYVGPFWQVAAFADETHIEFIWIIFMLGDGP